MKRQKELIVRCFLCKTFLKDKHIIVRKYVINGKEQIL